MYKLIKFFCAPLWAGDIGDSHTDKCGQWDNHALSEQNYYLGLNKFCYK